MEAPRELPCPRCGTPLDTETAASHYGSRVEVERCAGCGGVFTSWGRILALSPQLVADWEERIALDPAVPGGLVRASLPCPACGRALAKVTGATLPRTLKVPDDVELHVCDKGDGFWIEAETLTRFKHAQSSHLARKRESYVEELEAKVTRQRAKAAALGFDRATPVRRAYSSAVVFLLFLVFAAILGTTLLRSYLP
ncbi:MAG: zf-TFIIB domain-containing protein [Deltaproteobacteria bacterium]|nr:zf-TFIIB domain-containing protein [Deltaproteobacteria bacterium]